MVAVGVGVSWMLFALMSKLYELNFIEYAVIALPGLLSVAFAMIRVNDLPLSKYILLMLEFSIKPKKRVWDHRGIALWVMPDMADAAVVADTHRQDEMMKKAEKAANLKNLSMMLDSGGFEHVKPTTHKDIDVVQDTDLVTEAYFGNEDRSKMNMYWRTKESHLKRLEFFAKLPVTQLKAGTQEVELARQEIARAKEAGETARKEAARAKSKLSISKPPPSAPRPTPPKAPPPPPKPPSPPVAQAPSPKATPPAVKPPVASAPKNQSAQPPKAAAKPSQVPVPPKAVPPQPPKAQAPDRTTHVDTTQKNAPAKYIPKPTPPQAPKENLKPAPQAPREETKAPAQPKQAPTPPIAEKPAEPGAKGGEFKFEELKKGEIEINLD